MNKKSNNEVVENKEAMEGKEMNSESNEVMENVEEERNNLVAVNPNTGEVIQAPSFSGIIESFSNPNAGNFYASIKPQTRKERVALYNAINSADYKLSSLGETQVIEAVDVVAHEVVLEDMQTKQPVKCARVVIIDKNGKTYEAISQGVVSSLSKIFSVIGMPDETWHDEPVKMVLKKVRTRKGFITNTLTLVD